MSKTFFSSDFASLVSNREPANDDVMKYYYGIVNNGSPADVEVQKLMLGLTCVKALLRIATALEISAKEKRSWHGGPK